MYRYLFPTLLPTLLLCAAFMLAGCGRDSPDQLLSLAKSHMQKGDNAAAIIQLQNALQQQPALGEARLLLGKALLDRGDAVRAAAELTKALDLSVSADQVKPLLARALVDCGQTQMLLAMDTSDLTSPQSVAEFNTALAEARSYDARAPEVQAALDAALNAVPDYTPALVGRARVLFNRKQFAESLQQTEAVLSKHPADVDALVLKADNLFHGQKQTEAAIALYRQALSASPRNLVGQTALIEALLIQHDSEGAQNQADALFKAFPRHPLALYFQALLAAQSGNLARGEEMVNQLLKMAPDDSRTLHLAGTIALESNRPLLAQGRLSRLVAKAPESSDAKRLLAQAYLQSGDGRQALETIESLLAGPKVEAETLAIAARAHMLAGDFAKAQDFYSRAFKANPLGTQARVGAALARFKRGQTADGLRELQAAATSDSKGIDADLTLVSVLVSQRELDAALSAIARLEAKAPGKVMAPLLQGQVLVLKGDLAAARKSFEAALAADPAYFPATDRLAALDWREGKRQSARARLDAYLKDHRNNAQALAALANLVDQAGTPPAEVTALYAKAVKSSPEEAWLRQSLIQYHLRRQDFKQALSAAQDAASALPGNTEIQLELGRAQAAAGDHNQAIKTFAGLALKQPQSLAALLGLADAYIATKAYSDAFEAVKRAVQLAPDSMAVAQRAAKLDLQAGHPDAAVARARALQKGPQAFEALVMEGDLEASRKNWAAAESAYRKALKLEPTASYAAQRVFATLRAADRSAQAEQFAEDWEAGHATDPLFPFFRAGVAIADKAYAKAETQLRKVLKIEPDNAMSLNNLAWVLAAQKQAGAIELAERAVQLGPNQTLFLDTLAYAQAAQAQIDQAIETQQRALSLEPANPDLSLGLARLYLQAGKSSKAREALRELVKLGERYGRQAEVQSLLAAADR